MDNLWSFAGVMAGLVLFDPLETGLLLLALIGVVSIVTLAIRGIWLLGKRWGAT